MQSIKGKIALVTGASSGIGESTVEALLSAGAVVYAAARRIERMKELEKKGARIIAMDVTDDASIGSAVGEILGKEGSIDILINNAGYGSYGAIEEVPIEEGRRQFEVNLFGLARLTQLVIPVMRKNGYGKIVNISSIGGKMYTGFGGWYHATKHALEGFSDCLRIETEPFGIDVVVIEPGGIHTEWGAISAENLTKNSGSGPYAAAVEKVVKSLTTMYSSGKLSKPSVISHVILKAVTARKPRTRYAAGYMSGLTLFLRRWLSDRMFDRIITNMVS